MTWVERIDKRTRRNKHFQDDVNSEKFAVDAHLATLHYESALDSGLYDTEVDLTPLRIDNAAFDGWRVTENGWHYALGIDKINHPGEDGWVGFGGRQGAHWLKFRLEHIGYIHWPTRNRTFLGGIASYTRPGNLSNTTNPLTIATTGQTVNVEQVAEWANLWATPGGGVVNIRWKANGDGLKEEIVINQAGRDYAATQYPGTPTDETYFCYAFRLDVSDIPRWVKNGILQDIEGDFDDDDGTSSIELRDALDRLLAFLPVDDAIVLDSNGQTIGRQRLRKRIFKEGSDYYLVVGARADLLNALPAGDLIFDPTINPIVGAGSADGRQYDVGSGAELTDNSTFIRSTPGGGYYVYAAGVLTVTGPASGDTIDVAYSTIFVSTTDIDVNIDLEDSDDAPALSTATNNISGRTLTGNSVRMTDSGGAFRDVNSPSMVSAFQDVVNRGGWSSGNDMCMVVQGASSTGGALWFYENASANAFRFHIEYSAGGTNYSDTQATYLRGQSTSIDSQALYLLAILSLLDTQPLYLAGLTYFPFTDDFTGSNNDPWSLGKWKTETN